MNLQAEKIKDAITMSDIFYRYTPQRQKRGAILCPFHDEKTPSMTTYANNERFHCFGCGADGSVIDFVMKLFDITFRQAIIRINNDFGIYTDVYGRSLIHDLKRQQTEKQKQVEKYRKEYSRKIEEFRALISLPPPPDTSAERYSLALAQLEYLQYWFEINHWR